MTPKHQEASSLEDYSHWNEEASIVKAREDRYADYYHDDYDDDEY